METTDPTSSSGAKRRRFTEAERSEHLTAWKRSGRSVRAYAAEHGLSAASLYAWSKKQRAGGERACAPSSPFVPVRIAPAGLSAQELRVTLKTDGLECIIEGAAGPEAFATLAAALKQEVLDV